MCYLKSPHFYHEMNELLLNTWELLKWEERSSLLLWPLNTPQYLVVYFSYFSLYKEQVLSLLFFKKIQPHGSSLGVLISKICCSLGQHT